MVPCHGCVSNKKRGGRPHLHVATGRQSGGSPPVQRGVAAQCGPCDALRSSIAPPSSECNHSAAEGLRRRRGVGSPRTAPAGRLRQPRRDGDQGAADDAAVTARPARRTPRPDACDAACGLARRAGRPHGGRVISRRARVRRTRQSVRALRTPPRRSPTTGAPPPLAALRAAGQRRRRGRWRPRGPAFSSRRRGGAPWPHGPQRPSRAVRGGCAAVAGRGGCCRAARPAT